MYTKIVNAVIDAISSTYGKDYSIDDIKMCLKLAIRITSNCGWSNEDYNDMFDDVILGLDHPGEKFIEPLN